MVQHPSLLLPGCCPIAVRFPLPLPGLPGVGGPDVAQPTSGQIVFLLQTAGHLRKMEW